MKTERLARKTTTLLVVAGLTVGLTACGQSGQEQYESAVANYQSTYAKLVTLDDKLDNSLSSARDAMDDIEDAVAGDFDRSSETAVDAALTLHEKWGDFETADTTEFRASQDPAIESGTATEDGYRAAAKEYEAATEAAEQMIDRLQDAENEIAKYAAQAAEAQPAVAAFLAEQEVKEAKARLTTQVRDAEALITQFDSTVKPYYDALEGDVRRKAQEIVDWNKRADQTVENTIPAVRISDDISVTWQDYLDLQAAISDLSDDVAAAKEALVDAKTYEEVKSYDLFDALDDTTWKMDVLVENMIMGAVIE